jgi:hypothetical protein
MRSASVRRALIPAATLAVITALATPAIAGDGTDLSPVGAPAAETVALEDTLAELPETGGGEFTKHGRTDGTGRPDDSTVAADRHERQEARRAGRGRAGHRDDRRSGVRRIGPESLADGIHTDSPLTRGKSYQLGVACAGQGKAKLPVHVEGEPVVRSFDCDGTAVHQRITKAPSRLRVDVDGEPGSSGMVAWRISETGT